MTQERENNGLPRVTCKLRKRGTVGLCWLLGGRDWQSPVLAPQAEQAVGSRTNTQTDRHGPGETRAGCGERGQAQMSGQKGRRGDHICLRTLCRYENSKSKMAEIVVDWQTSLLTSASG